MKLDVLSAAQVLEDVRSPPGNRLEASCGDLRGFFLHPHQQSVAYYFPLASLRSA